MDMKQLRTATCAVLHSSFKNTGDQSRAMNMSHT